MSANRLEWFDGLAVDEDVIALLCDADSAALGERDRRHYWPIAFARQHAYVAEA